jgi:hypothetical protein
MDPSPDFPVCRESPRGSTRPDAESGAMSTKNRLLSIHRDSTTFLKDTVDFFQKHASKEIQIDSSKDLSEVVKERWPVAANERCGSVSNLVITVVHPLLVQALCFTNSNHRF